MKILADTNTFLAVALHEPERDWLIEATHGAELAAPAVLPFEVGNALSALVKRERLTPRQATDAWQVIQGVSVELVEVEIATAMSLAMDHGIYAYDAYFLHSAMRLNCPLLTLDRAMTRIAKTLKIRLVEKP